MNATERSEAMEEAERRTRGRENNRKGGAEQTAFVKWCDYTRGKWPALATMIGIPNGALLAGNVRQRSIQAARLKAEGMRKGVPDFFLPVARGGFNGLFIEMKSGNATASKEQRAWIEELRKQGYRAEVCQGWQCAAGVVTEYMEAR